MRALLAACTVLFAGGCWPAAAHDWYPSSCCGGEDCHRLSWEDVEIVDYRNVRVRINGKWLDVRADAIRSEPSPDGFVHVCYSFEWILVATRVSPEIRCVFLPAAS
jgi:hypothetical protein